MDYPSAQVTKSRGLNKALYADTQPQPFCAPRTIGGACSMPRLVKWLSSAFVVDDVLFPVFKSLYLPYRI